MLLLGPGGGVPFDGENATTPVEAALGFCKPASGVVGVVSRFETRETKRAELRDLGATGGLHGLIGRSPALAEVTARIPKVARSDAAVLLIGETGTGKELCAHAIHELSPRAAGPFVPINCGALPLDIADNELFGHVSGAFTHADRLQHGLVHAADGGTLFLDEVDALPAGVQVKLLRFLQDREYRMLGSTELRSSNLRLLAALNSDPLKAVEEGRLRRDLYYRLNTVALELPPLRDRRDDIPDLVQHFLDKHGAVDGREGSRFSDVALAALLAHDWPGNVRELEQVVRRAMILSESAVIGVEEVEVPGRRAAAQESFQEAKDRMVRAFERSYLESLLRICAGNITRAADLAQKNRRAFFELLRKHQLDAQRFRPAR